MRYCVGIAGSVIILVTTNSFSEIAEIYIADGFSKVSSRINDSISGVPTRVEGIGQLVLGLAW